MSAERAAEKPPTRRRWRVWVLLALSAGGATWFAHFAYLRIRLKPTPRPGYWAAKYAELVEVGPDAVTSSKAQSILSAKPWAGGLTSAQATERHAETVVTGDWDAGRADVRVVRAVFTSQRFRDAVAAVRRLAITGWTAPYVPRIYPDRSFRWELDSWCDWLLAHSRWIYQERRDAGAVVEDWLTVLRLARALDKERTLGSTRDAASYWGGGASEMMFAAVDDAVPIDARSLAVQVDAILGPQLPPFRVLAGEGLGMHAALEDVYVRTGGDWLVVNACAPWRFRWFRGVAPSRLWNLTSPLFHDLKTARANVERYMASTAQLGNLVDCANVARASQDVNLLVSELDGLESVTQRWAAYVLAEHYKARCAIDAAVTLLAINQHYRQSGRYPAGLADLVPEYLPRLPIDYADMQLLRYRREGDGFVLYSIASDGVDHGGRPAESGFTWPRPSDQADAVFSLARRPEKPE